jgi:AcrR family transcriptional regulator
VSARREEPLTPGVIVEAALAVVSRIGLDRLTMRAVATELGVSPMAIYHHLADKNELVEAMLEEIQSYQGLLVLEEDGWEAALRRYLLTSWASLTRYPGVSSYLLGRPLFGATQSNIDRGIAFFRDAGFSQRNARLALALTLTYLHGRLSVDAHLRGPSAGPMRFQGIGARDHVEFGIAALVAGIANVVGAATGDDVRSISTGDKRPPLGCGHQ